MKTDFAAGETVYVKGLGLEPNTAYSLWIQPDGVQISPLGDLDLRSGFYIFSPADDPSDSQETIQTDDRGDFVPTAVWTLNSSAAAPLGYDIVADNLSSGITGTFEAADSISNAGWEGFTAFSTAGEQDTDSQLPISWGITGGILAAAVITVLLFMVMTRRRKSHSPKQP
jgi:hypothetical protein